MKKKFEKYVAGKMIDAAKRQVEKEPDVFLNLLNSGVVINVKKIKMTCLNYLKNIAGK